MLKAVALRMKEIDRFPRSKMKFDPYSEIDDNAYQISEHDQRPYAWPCEWHLATARCAYIDGFVVGNLKAELLMLAATKDMQYADHSALEKSKTGVESPFVSIH